jgi:hypothetical protein
MKTSTIETKVSLTIKIVLTVLCAIVGMIVVFYMFH